MADRPVPGERSPVLINDYRQAGWLQQCVFRNRCRAAGRTGVSGKEGLTPGATLQLARDERFAKRGRKGAREEPRSSSLARE